MEKYEALQLEVIFFDSDDVITTSDGINTAKEGNSYITTYIPE